MAERNGSGAQRGDGQSRDGRRRVRRPSASGASSRSGDATRRTTKPKRRTSAPAARPSSSRPSSAGRPTSAARNGSAARRPARRPTSSHPGQRRGAPRRGARGSQSSDRTVLAIGIAALVACVLAVVLVVRGIAGCVSRVFAPAAQEQKQEATEESAAPKSQAVQIDLVMIGDILQHSGVFNSGMREDGTRNYDHVFAHITSELEGADLKVVNQETILGGESFGFSGYPAFNGPQEMGDAEVAAGFNVVLRATNHALDYGYEGLHSELAYWAASHPEVAVLGVRDPDDPSATLDDAYIYEKDGFRVALLNYTYGTNDIPDPNGCVSLLEEQRVRDTVSAAKSQADMVVVFPHWGEEYNLEPIQDQYDMAQVFMDSGADVIIGGHPHVIEPVEVLTASDGRKVPCFWSVGNFISTQVDNENLVGGVAKVSLYKDEDGHCQVRAASFDATVTHKGIGTDMTTYLLRDYTDELAATNYLAANDTDNTSLTVAWANDFCTQVLGSAFDTATGTISFGPEAFEPSEPTSGDANATATSEAGDGAADADADATDADAADDLDQAA